MVLKTKGQVGMLNFPENYFQGEYREGFYIAPMMKRVWAAEMEVLAVVSAICKNYGIRYFADWGTMLGAVRHKGFVPWDDDMDIGMLREDYRKFIQIAGQVLPESYKLINLHTEKTFGSYLSRVVNTDKIRLDAEHLEKFHGCPYAVGVDIFPIDYIPRNKEDEELQKQLILITLSAAQLVPQAEQNRKELDEMLEQIQELCNVEFTDRKPLDQQLRELTEQLCSLYTAEDADCVTSIMDLVNGWEYRPSKECYAQSILMPFETIQVPVPVGYDEVLKVKYGDYMIPVNQSGGHDYPFYEGQEQQLKEYLKEHGMSGKPFEIDC